MVIMASGIARGRERTYVNSSTNNSYNDNIKQYWFRKQSSENTRAD